MYAYAGYRKTRRSTTDHVFKVVGGAISWLSRLQDIVTLSTTEVEYVALTEAAKEMIQLKRLLCKAGVKQENYVVHCDSQSAIVLSKNAIYNFKTKHIEVRYHFIQLALECGDLQVDKINIDKNLTDMLTNVISIEKN